MTTDAELAKDAKWHMWIIHGELIINSFPDRFDFRVIATGKEHIKRVLKSDKYLHSLHSTYEVRVETTFINETDEANEILECIPENKVTTVVMNFGRLSRAFCERQRKSLYAFCELDLDYLDDALAIIDDENPCVIIPDQIKPTKVQAFIERRKSKQVHIFFYSPYSLDWSRQHDVRCVDFMAHASRRPDAIRVDFMAYATYADLLDSPTMISSPNGRVNRAFEFRELYLQADRAGWWKGDGEHAVAKRVFDFFV